MSLDFSDKVAFITGGSTGIGHATALAFHRAGAKVVVADVNDDRGTMTVAEINGKGGDAFFVKCDVSHRESVMKAIRETMARYGRLDFAFNDAGIEGETASTADCSEENWDRVININLKGVWLCMKYQIAEMLRQGSGVIVNCSSVAGLIGFEGIPAYTASKHGVLGLTKTAALELAKSNIRVNAVCPGVIKTDMITRFTHGDSQAEAQLTASEPVGRMGKPQEVADAVLWLCSPHSSFVTGHALPVDGGWMAK